MDSFLGNGEFVLFSLVAKGQEGDQLGVDQEVIWISTESKLQQNLYQQRCLNLTKMKF